MRKVTCIVLSLVCFSTFVQRNALYAVTITGNTGPGGVGSTRVSSSLLYWLQADTIGLANGNPVSAWNDTKTFSPNNFTQATGSQQPTYLTSGINGKPSVSFDGAGSPNDDRLVLANSTTPATII